MAGLLRESVKNQTTFSLQLTKHLFHKESEKPTLVFSPLSIHVILSLRAARSGGKTLDHLLSLLRSQSIEELNSLASALLRSVLADGTHLSGPTTCFANSAWIQDFLTLEPSFKDIVDNVYKASVNKVDFIHKAEEIRGEINSWAEKETKGLIKDILPDGSVHDKTRLIFANALYFKGSWEKEFDAEDTKDYDFHRLKEESVRVPFMTSRESQLLSAYDDFKVLRLCYRRGEDKRCLSMYIILPNAMDGLPALVEKVASEPGFIDNHIPSRSVPTKKFRVPKFRISFGFEAQDMLEELAVGLDLEGSRIFHKSYIEFDEKGTEAAAVTVDDDMGFCLFDDPPIIHYIDFVADHPFLFLIREDITGAVLFIGRILDPSVSP